MNRARFLGGLILALLLLGGAVLLFRPRVMPPPGPGTAPATAASNSADFPRSFTDALGYQLTLKQPPRHIITMSPNLAEIVCAVGAGGQLVGVDDFTKFPPEAAAKPKVGGIINPDLERILALQPDLLLVARGLDKARIQRLRELGAPVATFDPQSLEQVLTTIGGIGQITGHDEQARKLVDSLRARRERVAGLTPRPLGTPPPAPSPRLGEGGTEQRPRVLLVIAWEGLFVGGVSGFANDLITTAGGINAVSLMKGISPDKPWPQVTRESVVVSDPQVIVFAGTMSTPSSQELAGTLEVLRGDPAWAHLSAVRNGRVAVLPEDPLTIPGPRLFEGLEALRKVIAAPASSAGTPPPAPSPSLGEGGRHGREGEAHGSQS